METTLLQDIIQFDRQATLLLNTQGAAWSDPFWQFLSGPVIWFVLCAAMALFLFIRLGWKRALVSLGACILAFALCDNVSHLVKHGLERLRPCWDEEMLAAGLRVLEGKGHQYGFFSAHAANAVSLALCSLLCLRSNRTRSWTGYAWLSFSLAFLIGISRVFVGKHYLGDVLTGFLVGLLFGCLAGLVGARLCSLTLHPHTE